MKKGKELAKAKSPRDNFMDINYNKDEETATFFKKYQADSQEFDWANLILSDEQNQKISEDYNRFLKDRRDEMRKWIDKYAKKFGNKRGHLDI
jgi:hypothetical protein